MHIMLDLETWGKRPGCDIRSIGAVVFDPITGNVSIPCKTCKGGTIRGNVNEGGDCSDCMNTRMERGYGDTFYIATDNPQSWSHQEGAKYPLTRDPETLQWWSEQSADAQAAFANPVDLKEACKKFTSWLCNLPSVAPVDGFEHFRIWANDPHFDVSILDAVFQAVQLPTPWHYRSPRSMKTITEAAGMTREDFKQFDHGTAHNALDDAISQALIVCEAYKRLGLQKA